MKKLAVLLIAALAIAVVVSLDWHPASFEERAIALELEHAPPALAAALQEEPLEIKAIVLDYADDKMLLLKAQAALAKYPQLARTVLPLYGDKPEFKQILATYGESVLPPIVYFLNNDVITVALSYYAAQKVQALKNSVKRLRGRQQSGAPATNAEQATDAETTTPLTREQRGGYAVNYIRTEGHDFLGQFVMDSEGKPKWIQTERVMEDINALFTSGIRGLETKLQTEQTPTAGDVGWAAVDSFVALGAFKLLRLGRAAATTGE